MLCLHYEEKNTPSLHVCSYKNSPFDYPKQNQDVSRFFRFIQSMWNYVNKTITELYSLNYFQILNKYCYFSPVSLTWEHNISMNSIW